MQVLFSPVFFQASFTLEIPLVLAYRVRASQFVTLTPAQFSFLRPNVHFHCDISYDPFLYMEEHNKIYCKTLKLLWPTPIPDPIVPAFTITMYEYLATIPTLWKHVMGSFFYSKTKQYIDFSLNSDFAHDHPEYIAKNNALGFMSSDNGKTYNLCHC
jgi:alpha 1,2-mannosyltransferase